MPTIKALREKIDQIDAAIIKKLAKRHHLAKQIGQLKAKSRKKVLDAKREQQLMHYYEMLSVDYALHPAYVKRLFKIIIAHSRNAQNKGASR